MPKRDHIPKRAPRLPEHAYHARLAEWELVIFRAASIISLLFMLAKHFWDEIKRW